MLSAISDIHVASRVPDGNSGSNPHAVESGGSLKVPGKNDCQQGQGAMVQAVRSSSEECISPSASHRPGIFSRLCSSLFCIRPVPESGTSVVLMSCSSLSSSPHNNSVDRLSPDVASGCDDAVSIAPVTGAGEGGRSAQLLSATPRRLEDDMIVDRGRGVAYVYHPVEPESCVYLDGKKHALTYMSDLLDNQGAMVELQFMKQLPFYCERISRQWHSPQFFSKQVFQKKELAFIGKSKIADAEQFSYIAMDNAFPQRCGSGKIYDAIRQDGSSMPSQLWVVEMHGELVPVRTSNVGGYEMYCRDKPAKTLAIAWDGVRWVSARHAASVNKILACGADVRDGDNDYQCRTTFKSNGRSNTYSHTRTGGGGFSFDYQKRWDYFSK